MSDLTDAEIQILAKAAGVEIPPHLVTEVGYSLNGLLEVLDRIEVPGLDQVEALPIILPPNSEPRS
ncbi:MAG: hypothetical protein ACE5Q6_16320 [Dehalococcoidia bacterium]